MPSLTVIMHTKCPTCGAVRARKADCGDCRHSFRTPFDELLCGKGRAATRPCRDFAMPVKKEGTR
jgi:hypothetical protein